MEVFQRSSTSFPRSVYVRIMILSCLDAFITLPTGVAYLCLDLFPTDTIIRWPGWGAVHANISKIVTLSTSEWDQSRRTDIIFVWYFYINVFWAVTFFIFFGFTYEMRRRYSNVLWRALSVVGIKKPASNVGSSIRFTNGLRTRPLRYIAKPFLLFVDLTRNRRRDTISFPSSVSSSLSTEVPDEATAGRRLTDVNIELQGQFEGKMCSDRDEEAQSSHSIPLSEDDPSVQLEKGISP